MPIHKLPSVSSHRADTLTGLFVEKELRVRGVNLTPSKRTRPALVPTQRKPSRVGRMAATESAGNPTASAVRQTRKVPAVSARSKPEPSALLSAGKNASRQIVNRI